MITHTTLTLDPRGCSLFKSCLSVGEAEIRGVLVRCDKHALFWKSDWSFTPLTRLMAVLWLHCVISTCRFEAQHIPKTHGKCGHHCGAADHSLCILPFCVCYNDFPLYVATMLDSELQSPCLASLFSLGQYQSPTLAVASRHFLYKDCFWWNCKKLLLIRGEKTFPPAELKRTQRVPRWPSLCECWAVEVLKKRQASDEFKWWMSFFMS